MGCVDGGGAETMGPGGHLQIKSQHNYPASHLCQLHMPCTCQWDWMAGGLGTHDLKENCSKYVKVFNVDWNQLDIYF